MMVHLKQYVRDQNSNDELKEIVSKIKNKRASYGILLTNPLRMKFTIKVGDISPVEALKYLEKIVKSIK